MANLRDMIRALFRPTPPPTEEERKRMAEAQPATDDEIAAAKGKHGWKTSLPGAG
jgi:hypothetical protein